MPKTGGENHLGIYISPKEICIAQVKIGKDLRPEPEHLVKFETGFPIKEGILRPLSLNNEFFNEKAAWVAPFRQAVEKISWGTASAVVTLSPQFAILRYFVMPSIDRRFWGKSIPLESKKYIPVSFEEVIYDYNAEPAEDPKKLGVLFGLTQRKSVEFITETLKAAGLSLSAVEINSASLERLFGFVDRAGHGDKGYVHFSGDTTLMLFSHGGYPVLYRETGLEFGGAMSERRRLDIKGAINFVDRYIGGGGYKVIAMSGDGAETWKPAAEREAAPIAVETWDCAKACSLRDNTAASLFAFGAALRGRAPAKLKLDISGISTGIDLGKQVQGYVWSLALFLGGMLLLYSLISQIRLMLTMSKLADLQTVVETVPELQGSSADEIKKRIDKLQLSAKVLDGLVTDTDFLAPKLSAIVDNIPSELWIVGIQYSNPFSLSDLYSGNRELKLGGETFLSGETKIRAVDSFAKSLKGAETFKVFTPPHGSIDSINDDSSRRASDRQGVLQRVGSFSVMCLSKKK